MMPEEYTTPPPEVHHRFLDEAGDTTFFGKGKVNALGQQGVSLAFALGMVKFNTDLKSVRESVVELQKGVEADGYFLSCTNTRMIETIPDLERDLGKPVINSNQATIWACLKKLGIKHSDPRLGRLFN